MSDGSDDPSGASLSYSNIPNANRERPSRTRPSQQGAVRLGALGRAESQLRGPIHGDGVDLLADVLLVTSTIGFGPFHHARDDGGTTDTSRSSGRTHRSTSTIRRRTARTAESRSRDVAVSHISLTYSVVHTLFFPGMDQATLSQPCLFETGSNRGFSIHS